MMGKWLRTISNLLTVGLVCGLGSAPLAAQEIDFEYRCIIVKTQSSVNQTTTLPTGETQLSVGESFFVEFWATDSGISNPGLVFVITDMDYPQNLVGGCLPDVTSLFGFMPTGTCDGLIVDELGGGLITFSGGVGAAPEWARVAYVQFTADVSGNANFVLEPAQGESSAFGVGIIPPANIDYGSCSVTIGVVVEETGACCDFSDACTENVTESDCLLLSGRYLGDSIACADDPDGDSFAGCSDICPASPAPMGVDFEGRPLGDVDEDCDVDLVDYWIFQGNISGPSQ